MDQEQTGAETAGSHMKAARHRSLVGGLSVILSIVAFSMSAYLWYMLARKDAVIGAQVVPRLGRVEAAVTAMAGRVDQTEQQLQQVVKAQGGLQEAIVQMNGNNGERQRRWAVSEAEQLLEIANHRLQLDHEVGFSLAALKAADRELQRADDPRLMPIRQTIANEVRALEALRKLDISGLALSLQSMAATVDQLPLGPETRYQPPVKTRVHPEAVPADHWQRFLAELKVDLSNLIRIQRNGQSQPPLLPPTQAYYARQNLKLMLYSAQLALLEHQDAVYGGDVARARRWLLRYFDASSAPVKHMAEDLTAMGQKAQQVRAPDISASLEALRRIVAGQGQS